MWLKVCGVTRREDAEAAAGCGASAVGFVFWNRSPRCVSARAARVIGEALPSVIERAGVFVNARREEILKVFEEARLTWVQLHGDEDLEFARSLGVPWVRAFRVRESLGAAAAAAFAGESHASRVILDTWRSGTPGGTGATFDWSVAASLRAALPGARLIVAGGLTPGNVAEAIRRVRPDGVDVSGGVEAAAGVKDAAKIAAFAAALREAAAVPGREAAR